MDSLRMRGHEIPQRGPALRYPRAAIEQSGSLAKRLIVDVEGDTAQRFQVPPGTIKKLGSFGVSEELHLLLLGNAEAEARSGFQRQLGVRRGPAERVFTIESRRHLRNGRSIC